MRTICFERVSPGRAFHAVLAHSRRPVVEHGHDFVELMMVTSGAGRHRRNGREERLAPGDARRLGPGDRHALLPDSGGMAWINVAFPAASWSTFLALAEIDPPVDFHAARPPFERVIRAYHEEAGGLALAAFLAEAHAPPPVPPKGPEWLARALATDAVEGGVPAMLAAACVSPSHLARAVRAATGRSPTELVVERRLELAACLLATTRREIGEIALGCGFPNLSYFYRSFRRRYGATPLESRLRTQSPPEEAGT